MNRVAPGEVLAEDVVDGSGQVLLRAGTEFTDAYIASLRARGLSAVRIADDAPDFVEESDPLPAEVRREATHALRTLFSDVTGEGISRVAEDSAELPRSAEELDRRLGPKALSDGRHEARMQQSVTHLIESVLAQPVLDGLAELKTHSDYTFTHSVEVAALGVGVGHRLGLDERRLRDLATGCLLHDIGKSLVDNAIIDKAGPLDASERALVEEHPRLGYDLIRRLHLGSVVPSQIALQHHERQDGSGYPRGLLGSNRVDPPTAERIDPSTMMLLAEVCAVADVHNAISSNRPYRPAMAPEQVMRVITESAGNHLNREIVTVLRAIVPVYPRGTWVEILNGERAGWRGQVTSSPPEDPYRPRVLLALDTDRELLDDPIPLDCSEERVNVQSLPSDQPPTEAPVVAAVGSR